MIQHEIVYFGQTCVAMCDAKCSKAWGICDRPKVLLGDADDEDDYAFLADDEVGTAPADPGTYEGGHGKPSAVDGGPASGRMNKWCVRACERSVVVRGNEDKSLPDFSKRRYNRSSRNQ